jgi:hypothetical protein
MAGNSAQAGTTRTVSSLLLLAVPRNARELRPVVDADRRGRAVDHDDIFENAHPFGRNPLSSGLAGGRTTGLSRRDAGHGTAA